MAYNDKSAPKCIEENDFISALENLQHANNRWVKHWFNCCITIMENDTQWRAQYEPDYEYCEFHPTAKNNVAVQNTLHSIWYYNGKEIFTNGKVPLLDSATQKCYLFRFFNTDGFLVCSKVGTTTKPILDRIKSELREYDKLDVVSCVIDRIYDCGERPAEGMESYFRALYIAKHPTHFRKNDRFFSVSFNLEDADEICAQYLALN
jgi:hypothetical protein